MPTIRFDLSLWLPLLALVCGAIVHALSADEGRSVLEKFGMPPVPRSALPWLTIVFGLGAGVADNLVAGQDFQQSLIASITSVFAGVFGLNATRVVHGAVSKSRDDGDTGGGGVAIVLLAVAFALAPSLQGCATFSKIEPLLPTADQIACVLTEAENGQDNAALVVMKCGIDQTLIHDVESLIAGHHKAKATRLASHPDCP